MGQHATRIEADRFLKTYPSAQAAALALRRTKLARAAGVVTPDARVSARAELGFALIAGACGAELLPDLKAVLAPLRGLAAMPPADFAALDPFRRIRPRLHLAPPALRDRVDQLMHQPMPSSGHVCHGDFHPGQVIRDAAGTSWLIDLDDLAVAGAAADLGNLIAYLATSQPRPGTIAAALGQWTDAVMTAWGSPPQHLSMADITYFTEIALIRRALKVAERGDLAVLDQISAPLSAA